MNDPALKVRGICWGRMEFGLRHDDKRLIFVLLFLALVSYVLAHRGFGDGSRRATEIPNLPHMLAPERLSQPRELHLKLAGRFTFHILDDPADRDVGRYRKEQMDMVGTDRSPKDIHLFRGAYLAEDVTEPQANIVNQYLLAVLCYPDDMVLVVVGRMARMTISACHVLILSRWQPDQAKASR